MRKLKSLWLVSVVLLLVSCSMSAKSDKSSEAGTASKGEVVTLNKAEFLQRYSITRRTQRNGYMKVISLVSSILCGLVWSLQASGSYFKGFGYPV